MNWIPVLLSALIPMAIGFIWYNPKIGFGKAWMKASGMTMEMAKGANMAVVFGLSLLFAVLIAMSLMPVVIHQMGFNSMMLPGPHDTNAPELQATLAEIMEKYGTRYRTFKHGMLHGGLTAIFLVLPVIGTNALFERKGGKYIFIHVGYWFVSLMLMGGVICAFA